MRRLLFVCVAFASAVTLTPAGDHLSLVRRIEAQRAIERLYYGYQIGADEPFETARPPAFLREKALRALRLSAALDSFWHTPITAEMLWRETERIARDTRFPDRLIDLYGALGNDPVLYQETVARAALAERMAREAFVGDDRIQDEARHEAATLAAGIRSGAIVPGLSDARVTVTEVRIDNRAPERGVSGDLEEFPGADRGPTVELSRVDFEALRARLSGPDGERASVRETPSSYVVRALVSDGADALTFADYTIPKRTWDEWWTATIGDWDAERVATVARGDRPLPAPATPSHSTLPLDPGGLLERFGAAAPSSCGSGGVWSNGSLETPPPDNALGATAVWTGSELIVWGGTQGTNILNSGSRYDPVTGTWRPTSRIQAPGTRSGHTAVWTGSRMIVWGGASTGICQGSFSCSRGDGGLYDPATDSWQPIGTAGVPIARHAHAAVWTGSLMLVWGGITKQVDGSILYPATGGRYDPTSNSWTSLSTPPVTSARSGAGVVWTGSRMIVWGGFNASGTPVATGGLYDPASDTWTATSNIGAPPARYGPSAVWTGQQMLVWGGQGSGGKLATGGRYDPVLNQWTTMTDLDAPLARTGQSTAWTGSQMLVWGGVGSTGLGTGARYEPGLDRWTPMTLVNAPAPRSSQSSVWSGDRLYIWGGQTENAAPVNNAGYDPVSDSWSPMTNQFVPMARTSPLAVWTGNLMIIAGGGLAGGLQLDHGRYDPLLDLWTPNAPYYTVPQSTAVWTGQLMILWGGNTGSVYNPTGARYDPATDVWQPTSTINAPEGRVYHTAVWTGSRMIVWGGSGPSLAMLDTGGLYDPATDSWSAMPFGGPTARYQHTAIWTGSRMIVWGGDDSTSGQWSNTGAIYDPASNAWTGATPLGGAPSPRFGQSALWTGTEMLIWGGTGPTGSDIKPLNTGALYNPSTGLWRHMSATNAPVPLPPTSLTWTGSRMLAWGGTGVGSGGQYEVATDTWTVMPDLGSPEPRPYNAAVQAGPALIVWGGGLHPGISTPGVYNTGGLYCPCTTGVNYYADGDRDGHGDSSAVVLSCGSIDGYAIDGGDCNDAASDVWRLPSETGLVTFVDATHLVWLPPGDPGGSAAVRYDLLRSDGPDVIAGGTCRASDLAVTDFEDSEVPAAGSAFYYKLRAGNGCGEGAIGVTGGGAPIYGGPSCP